MADSLWDKIGKFADVVQRQGLGQAIGLAKKDQVATEDRGVDKEWFENYSEHILSEAHQQKDRDFEDKIKELQDSGGTDAVNKFLDSEEGNFQMNEIYGSGQAKGSEVWHKTKVYDDDLFDWSGAGDDRALVPSIGEGEKGVLMPTRPGAYGKDAQYIPLHESIMGKWLTPDEGGGLIMTDKKQEGSIERMRSIWKHGDTLEGAFANEGTYNLLFEDKQGDVSIVQTSDYLHKSNEKKSHSGVMSLIEKLDPQNIYYQDAGMNASFYPRSYYDDDDMVPYGNTTTMMGKFKDGENFINTNRTSNSFVKREHQGALLRAFQN
jgi:hypothetical protein